jgi:hypothetical protein
MAAAGGDLEHYIGEETSDANATGYFTGKTYNQARGYLYYDTVASGLKIWDGSSWLNLTAAATGSGPWTRDAGGFIYAGTATDDLYIGGSTPNGVWFDDGDMVLGAAAMSGTEVLRVVGDARVEGKLTVTGLIDPTGLILNGQTGAPASPGADKGLIWVDDSVDPVVLRYRDDADSDFSVVMEDGTGDVAIANDLEVGNDLSVGGKLTVTGLIDPTGVLLDGQAVAPASPGADKGLFWVDDSVDPTIPKFTDETDTDYTLAYLSDVKSLPDISQVLWVDKTSGSYTPDGSIQAPYNSINSAIAAVPGTPSATNRWVIFIMPGIYAEAVVTTDDYVDLVGFDKHTTIIQQSSTSRPLTIGARNMAFRNLTFECASGCTANIVYRNDIGTDLVRFDNCDFLGTNGNANNFFYTDRGSFEFHACRFLQSSTDLRVFLSEVGSGAGEYQRFYDCEFEGAVRLNGQDTIDFYDCTMVSSAANGVWFATLFNGNTTQLCRLHGCRVENTGTGWAIYNNALNSTGWLLEGCDFVVSTPTSDIDGGNYLQKVTVSGNSMSKGMAETVRTANRVKYAGGQAGNLDWYTDIEEAVNSLSVVAPSNDDGCIIYMMADYSSSAQVQQDQNITVTIDGQECTWTDTVPASGFTFLATTGKNVLKRINFVDASIGCQGSATKLYIDNCDIRGNVSQRGVGDDADTKTVIHGSSVYNDGVSAIPEALGISSSLPTIIVSHSYLKGYNSSSGYAVDFNLTDNDNFKAEHSTLMHGQLGSNNPFGNPPTSGDIDYAVHHCTMNQEPMIVDSTKWNNTIDPAQRFNTIDVDGDFDFRAL